MPERAAYDEAMLLSQARLKVQDQDLKQGKVETITLQTVAGTMKRPWGIQGGFAVVYKFATQSGNMRALRCFLAKMDPDIQLRYERIAYYFATHVPGVGVEFKYYDNGILLKEVIYGQILNKTYPLVEMEWIEGLTLVDYVDELCLKWDTATLGNLVSQWETIIKTLQQAHISHGDLAGVNIMVRPDGRLVLVDYDGVYIPDFAGLKPIVLGQADYQHPQMTLRPFNERTDDFSAWVIYTALLALHLQPGLWPNYMHHNQQGVLLDTNLLFRKDDFTDPDQSALFTDLLQINDTRLHKATLLLIQACKQSITLVPEFDPDQLDPDANKKLALAKLKQAIQNNDEEEIVQAWVPQLLDSYGPAQQYIPRVAQAKQAIETLKRFHDALRTHSIQQIVNAYDPIILTSKQFTTDQAERLLLALEFAQAYQNDDDQAIVATWDDIENSRFKSLLIFTTEEQQRHAIAQKRREALVKFRMALLKKHVLSIADSYDAVVLDNSTAITTRERELLRIAQDFAQAYRSDDDRAIVTTSEEILNFSYRADFTFTTQEKQRIELAQLRKLALVKFRMGLMSKNMSRIIASYDWVLDDSTSITQQERTLLQMARAFVQASYKNDNEALVAAWDTIEKASYQSFFQLSSQERQRIDTARLGQTALPKFRRALASGQLQQIVSDYDPLLDNDRTITQEERSLLALARNLVQAWQHDDDQEIASAWDEIQAHQSLFTLTAQEQQRVTLAQKRKVALVKFRMALMSKRIQQIVASYDTTLDTCNNVTASEQMQLSLARELMQAFQRDNDRDIAAAWAAIQHSPHQRFFLLTAPEMQRVALAQAKNTF
ncbi:MAG TPA: hypothetical protein VL485_20355 [Ktedonobacteraceae bacterium]|jgi:hypothetical protein|nr:hypothetical protein [Ktedonobacteraceae bacterium]